MSTASSSGAAVAGAPRPSAPSRPDSSSSKATAVDPVLRNALRYTVSAREYAALHKYILSRSRILRRATPSPAAVEKAMLPPGQQRRPSAALTPQDKDGAGTAGGGAGGSANVSASADGGYNATAVRHATRVFLVTFSGIKGWEAIARRLQGKDAPPAPKQSLIKSNAFRLSLSLSSILFLYRLLFRFLVRLRGHLLASSVEPFRRRNPRVAATLTSAYAPAVGASLAGLALGVYPSEQLRVSVALLLLFRALEFGWNLCEGEGYVWGVKNGRKRERPWWFGSWMLQPLAFGQLLHACVFDRETFPGIYGSFMFKFSPVYLHERPDDWPAHLTWPGTFNIIDSLAEMARLSWPKYISPTMFPNKEQVLPATLAAVSPLTSRAHPLITSLSCATLHPSDPSCARTYLTFWLNCFPPMTRLFVVLYSALTVLPNLRGLYNAPLTTARAVLAAALRTTTFATGAISTFWASVCLAQAYLPRHVLATQRFFLGGFLAGLWAWVERRGGRGLFLSTTRESVNSLWKVGIKRRWWKAMRGGDVWVFVLALMLTGVVYEKDAKAVEAGAWRKGVSWMRGEGFRDWSIDDDDEDEDEAQEGHEKEE